MLTKGKDINIMNSTFTSFVGVYNQRDYYCNKWTSSRRPLETLIKIDSDLFCEK